MSEIIKLENGQYFGRIEHRSNLNGLLLTNSNYQADVTLPSHFHANPYLCFIMEGGYSEYYNKKNNDCKKGDLIFHPKNFEHHNAFNAPYTKCLNIEFTAKWINDFSRNDIIGQQPSKITDVNAQILLQKIYHEFKSSDTLSTLMIESLVAELLIFIYRKKEKDVLIPGYIKKVTEFIHDNHNKNPSLTALAEHVSISPEHLTRVFKKIHHLSIGEYVRQVKIKYACDKLVNTDKSLVEISFELGFSDQSHFCRVFKSLIGVTPLSYRSKN